MQTRMYIAVGRYRSGGLQGRQCSASFYSKARNDYELRRDAGEQNGWLRVESYSEVTGDYGGCPVSQLIAWHDAKFAA
jgi:hypothetical protein